MLLTLWGATAKKERMMCWLNGAAAAYLVGVGLDELIRGRQHNPYRRRHDQERQVPAGVLDVDRLSGIGDRSPLDPCPPTEVGQG